VNDQRAAERACPLRSGDEKFQTWTIPSGGGVVRKMMPTRDGNLPLASSGANGTALAEIKS